MQLDASIILDLLSGIHWSPDERVRLFWVKISDGARGTIAGNLLSHDGSEAIVPIILRDTLFTNANSVLSDFTKLIEDNRGSFESVSLDNDGRLTVVLLLKEDFKLAQISSPVRLPNWFPVLGGLETFLKISNLLLSAEVGLLHCPEASVEKLAVALYEVEELMVHRLCQITTANKNQPRGLLDILYSEKPVATDEALGNFQKTLSAVADPKAYRPNSMKQTSLLSLLLAQVLKSSPDKLSSLAKKLAITLSDNSESAIKPTFFAIMLRPSNKVDVSTRNWHSILLACFQSYQLMNAAAHAGEYPSYPVSLIHSNAQDLVRFLGETSLYIALMHDVSNVA
ncbi:hypothetical protein [Pseudomonas syringae]|uniref:hypothetical protein n=1 Tax=Pseudomonas syringae TaxID=317 RepID=UPI001BCF1F01|nr:hypothetical protein [Pseudomonas syringae]MBS7413762.1 hypothetical protein [Pseudomonas syringae]